MNIDEHYVTGGQCVTHGRIRATN